jgi:hypothetical protein
MLFLVVFFPPLISSSSPKFSGSSWPSCKHKSYSTFPILKGKICGVLLLDPSIGPCPLQETNPSIVINHSNHLCDFLYWPCGSIQVWYAGRCLFMLNKHKLACKTSFLFFSLKQLNSTSPTIQSIPASSISTCVSWPVLSRLFLLCQWFGFYIKSKHDYVLHKQACLS